MLSPRWRKVLADLLKNKTRTAVVVLSIAVGVFAVGSVFSSVAILSDQLAQSCAAVNPANITIYTDPFEDDLVDSVQAMREVGAAEGRRSVGVRVKVGPNEWKSLQLHAIPDYSEIKINKALPESGTWPPPKRGILLERSSLGFANAGVGDVITVETPDGIV